MLSNQTQGTMASHAGGNPNDGYGRGGQISSTLQRRYKWQVWTKDGTLYEFEEDLWWGFYACSDMRFDLEAYKWLLSKVIDTHQNVINYNYDRLTYSGLSVDTATCGNGHVTGRGAVDVDAWPTSITWGGNAATGSPARYKVMFDSSARSGSDDVQFETAKNQYGNNNGSANFGSPRETRKLVAIKVQSNDSVPWQYSYGKPNYNSLGTVRGGQAPDWWHDGYYGTQDYPNSAALYYNAFKDVLHNNQAKLAHQRLKEFRGHEWVIETDPNGAQTKHWFYQGEAVDPNATGISGTYGRCTPSLTQGALLDDPCFQALRNGEFLKGREYRTQVFAAGVDVNTATPLQETLRHFSVSFLDYGLAESGLWRAFSYEKQTDETTYDNQSSTSLTKTTKYFYDEPNFTWDVVANAFTSTPYGNLTHIEELDAAGQPYRITQHWYGVRNETGGAYLVDRVYQETVRDGQNQVLAMTVNAYDTSTTNGFVGTKGELTLVRKLYDVPLVTDTLGYLLHGSDTSFGYDAWGNRTTETTYTGPGTRQYTTSSVTLSSPGCSSTCSTARTTTTAYDTIFHVFPTSITHPTVNGVTLSEQATYDYQMGTLQSVTDSNGAVSSAEYDQYGRLVKLIKPGDSTTYPTIQATYFDQSPFHYEVDEREFPGQAGVRILQRFYDGLGREIQTKRESGDSGGPAPQTIVVDTQYDGLGQATATSQPRYVNETTASFFQRTPVPGSGVNWTTTTYDELGRPLVVTEPDSTTPNGTKTTHTYRMIVDNGVKLSIHNVVDPNRHRMQYRSDALGRLVQVSEIAGNCTNQSYLPGFPCTGSFTTEWTPYSYTSNTYNPLDLLTGVSDAQGNGTTIFYDSLGRKTYMSDPDMGIWSYAYDTNGNLVHQSNWNDQDICFYYDALNRLQVTGPNLPQPLDRSYTYDLGGNVATIGDHTASQTQNFTYDERDRLTHAWTTSGASLAAAMRQVPSTSTSSLALAGASDTASTNTRSQQRDMVPPPLVADADVPDAGDQRPALPLARRETFHTMTIGAAPADQTPATTLTSPVVVPAAQTVAADTSALAATAPLSATPSVGLGRLPLAFVPNRGQHDRGVQYAARRGWHTVLRGG